MKSAPKKPVRAKQDKEPGLLQTLDQYWFGHGSPTSLGLFRIFIGILSFINCLFLWLHWESFSL